MKKFISLSVLVVSLTIPYLVFGQNATKEHEATGGAD